MTRTAHMFHPRGNSIWTTQHGLRPWNRKLRAAMAYHGLTPTHLALQLGLASSTVSNWCSGKVGEPQEPPVRIRMAEVLDVPYDWLFGVDARPPSLGAMDQQKLEHLRALPKVKPGFCPVPAVGQKRTCPDVPSAGGSTPAPAPQPARLDLNTDAGEASLRRTMENVRAWAHQNQIKFAIDGAGQIRAKKEILI